MGTQNVSDGAGTGGCHPSYPPQLTFSPHFLTVSAAAFMTSRDYLPTLGNAREIGKKHILKSG